MTNWKTTLAGILVILCTVAQNVANLLSAGTPINWVQIGIGALIAVGLFVAKDFNVTGAGPAAHTLTKPEVAEAKLTQQIEATKLAVDAANKDNS